MSPSSSAASKKPRLPRVFVVRHGETEWSISGQHVSLALSLVCPAAGAKGQSRSSLHCTRANLGRSFHGQTGRTDLPLTQNGERIIRDLGKRIVGPGKVLDPAHIQHVFVSPRSRAQKTFELLFEGAEKKPSYELEEGVREWEYGVCEGGFACGARPPSCLSFVRSWRLTLIVPAHRKEDGRDPRGGQARLGYLDRRLPRRRVARPDARPLRRHDSQDCRHGRVRPFSLSTSANGRPDRQVLAQCSPRKGRDGGSPRRHCHRLARPLQSLLHVRVALARVLPLRSALTAYPPSNEKYTVVQPRDLAGPDLRRRHGRAAQARLPAPQF